MLQVIWSLALVAGLLSAGCSRKATSSNHVAPSTSVVGALSVEPSDLTRLREQVSNGHAQGPVQKATFEEASVMILIDGHFRDACLVYLAADILQRAGYSVWPYYSHHLEGKYILLHSSGDPADNRIALQGAVGYEDISVFQELAYSSSESSPDPRDVQHLVAAFLRSPGFRKRIGQFPASESAGRFVTSPIHPNQLEALCSRSAARAPLK
jgi:hypothetical protein